VEGKAIGQVDGAAYVSKGIIPLEIRMTVVRNRSCRHWKKQLNKDLNILLPHIGLAPRIALMKSR